MKLLPEVTKLGNHDYRYVYPDGARIESMWPFYWFAYWKRGDMLTDHGKTARFGTAEDAAKALAEQGEGPCSLPENIDHELQIEESVCAKLIARRDVGRAKYGVTMDQALDKNTLLEWLVHQQEELMDAAIYIEAAIRKLKKGG